MTNYEYIKKTAIEELKYTLEELENTSFEEMIENLVNADTVVYNPNLNFLTDGVLDKICNEKGGDGFPFWCDPESCENRTCEKCAEEFLNKEYSPKTDMILGIFKEEI